MQARAGICEFLQGSVLAVRRNCKKFANNELLRSIKSFFYQLEVVEEPKQKSLANRVIARLFVFLVKF